MSLNHSLDVAPLLNDTLAHQTSVKRYLLEKKQDNFVVVEFGLEGRRVAKQDLEYFESRLDPEARRIVWLSEVKRT